MVTIISGGLNSNGYQMFTDKIEQSVKMDRNVFAVVPDQFSFEFDKALYNRLGAVLFNKISTGGINRLAQIITEKYGGSAGENADAGAKLILMFKAIGRVKKDDIHFYSKSLKKIGFIKQMTGIADRLRESGITPEMLEIAAENLNGTVSEKLRDIALIFRMFIEEMNNAGLKDSVSSVAFAVKSARENNFFEGMDIYIYSFTSFSFDEMQLLEVCMSSCDNFTVDFVIDDEAVKSFANNPFGAAVKTRTWVENTAKDMGKEIEKISCGSYIYNAHDIEFLGRNLFDLRRKKFEGKAENVRVLRADDIYEESEFICSEICRLVENKVCGYGDIVLYVRDINQCANVFAGVFDRYDIPVFIDCENRVSESSMANYFNGIFKTVLSSKYKTENVLKLIKSPLFASFDFDLNALEEYCLKWQVDEDMWLEDFTAGEDASALKRINELRKKVIMPLEKFKQSTVDKTAGEICRALYELLSAYELSSQTYSVVKRAAKFDNEANVLLGRNLKQLWNMTLNCVKKIYEIIGGEKITLREFCELFNLLLSDGKLSNPPQTLNCVRIADVSKSRIDGAKVVFAAEVNDGIFPSKISDASLITQREIELLKNLPEEIRVEIFSDAMHDFMMEKFWCYTAVARPTDKLYVLWSAAGLTGDEKRPSLLVKEVKEILGVEEEQISHIALDFFCTSYKTGYYKYLEHSADRSVESRALLAALNKNDFYADKIRSLKNIKEQGEFSLTKEMAEELFFDKDKMRLSPSALEKYFSCPFSFFCQYGLKLSPAGKMELNSLNVGNAIHNFLEKLLGTFDENAKKNRYNALAEKYDDAALHKRVGEIFDEYYAKKLGGDFGKSNQFKYAYNELKKSAENIGKFIVGEIVQSKFEPKLLEYKIEQERLVLNLADGKKIVIVGKIDRADVYTDANGRTYLRIIDYKTGSKDLSLSKLYHGLNLQMFVYLSALLEENNLQDAKDRVGEAGIIYYTVGKAPEFILENTDDENMLKTMEEENRFKALKPVGNVIDNEEILDAFGSRREYGYTPFDQKELDKKGNVILAGERFEKLRKFSMKKAEECGEKIIGGEFNALPAGEVCSYCEYSDICGNKNPENAVNVKDKMWEDMLEEELKNV